MAEWKRQGETVCMPNTVCCAMAADGEEARMIVARHNADVDALTADRDSECRWACQYKAERDELQRRLDAVVGECCGTRGMHARAVAIAEGRDND